jgi:acyl-CoA dehydrogenase
MYKHIFNRVKGILPRISQTEIIALKSGGVSIDREIFRGKINYSELYNKKNLHQMSATEKDFIQSTTNELLKKVGKGNIYPSKHIHDIMKYLGEKGFLSMIIDKEYNGNRMSIAAQSRVLSKISSYNPSLGVVTMVPNSLGPAELLQHYGTEQQKKHFLPKLADGTYIPCFGLTGPNNGSDATGKIDEGTVERVDGKIRIKIALNKRYITLAPISNLIGIAFHVKDPEGLLGSKKEGITVALIENSQPGLLQNTYHNPNNAGFPNGTLKGTVYIEPSQVIGGEEKIGEGWQMLMECLAVGRGVSLPATANGSSKMITLSILNYIQLRTQFNMEIGNMEAVKEKFVDMFVNTWIIHAGVQFTNNILCSGSTPSVITAIMKQQTTERARTILNHGMDIYSGSGICVGENNFFTSFYNSSPVGITVEGSNTLTRGLIIFGQGLNKSHPHIFPIFESIQENNQADFQKNFNLLVKDIACNYMSLFHPFRAAYVNSVEHLDYLTLKFSVLSNFVATLGGKIKSGQMISGNMADILSNLFLGYSLVWYHHHHVHNDELRDFCMDYLIREIEYKMNIVVENFPNPFLEPLLIPLMNPIRFPILEEKNKLYSLIVRDTELYNIMKEDIYYENTVLSKMEKLRKMKKDSEGYDALYQEIIRVGEFDIEKHR